MDVATVSTAFNSLKIAKDAFTWLLESKIEAESRTKVLDALRAVGDAQDNLFKLREDLFALQTENNAIKSKLAEKEEWKDRLQKYKLVQTEGGAIVYQSEEGTQHYACPSCIEKKEIQILQDRRVMSGAFACPGCGKLFNIKPVNDPPPTVRRSGHWME